MNDTIKRVVYDIVQDSIAKVVYDIVQDGIAKGTNVRKTAKVIQDTLNIDRQLALDLAIASSAIIRTRDTLERYNKSNVVDKVQIICGNCNCSNCSKHDYKIVDLSECKIGVNIPPFNVGCKGCIAPYID